MSAASSNLDDLELALALQREELQRLKKARKGKGREGKTDDFTLAIQLYEAELESGTLVASDHSLCASIARAVRLGADVISAIHLEEEQAVLDREFARKLMSPEGGMPITTPANKLAPTVPAPDEQLLARLEALNVSPEEHPPESSAWAASRPVRGTRQGGVQPNIECIGCGDKQHHTNISRCPCSHEYCRECLASLFTASLSDESLFPPRCCGQPIPLNSCRAYLPSELARQFLEKKVEMETPNKTYCYQPTCSVFIPQQFIDGEVATCTGCGKTTCVVCKGQSHEGDCPHDIAVQELLWVAAENGWQRCHSCRRCNIACRCGAQFCYVCGLVWKTCGCAQWNEARLFSRANDIVHRDGDAGRLGDVERANRVERERQNLMRNHECGHGTWRHRGGSHRCEVCHDVLPRYILECVQCRIMACRRCRFNRV
ncbi:hypothetical protein N657DRAFT_664647 [Parathielavia appendiculata]|uniref:RBR-type E3 ubiquitin transferase n=1 Tax=Parathielavia appendiculata TaxID=2587402 RepID=A0AAN6Z2U1_9PEZI|nr:hypothetical protein N657DRAFT_664647 [Parathielavia appendiculata]